MADYSRYRNRKNHPALHRPRPLWISLGAIAAVIGVAAVVLLMDPALVPGGGAKSLVESALSLGRKSLSKQNAVGGERVIYPYSIIAGGVHNKAEFEQAMKTDPVAAAHYADFDASKFHMVKLQKAEYAYVSFRVGDNVYWTSHKVELRAGEELISDGVHTGRTRCGNRVSKTAQLPTYDHEPSAKDLNTPARPQVETEAFSAVAPLGPGGNGGAPGAVLPPVGPGPTPQGGGITGGGPLASSVPGGCRANTNGDTHTRDDCFTASVIVPPAQTPENTTWVLWLTGALALAGYALARRHSAKVLR